jgi:hypothetical protein
MLSVAPPGKTATGSGRSETVVYHRRGEFPQEEGMPIAFSPEEEALVEAVSTESS